MLYILMDMPLHVVNYLFLVLLSSYLIPVDYGHATAITAYAAILIIPGVALQSAVARAVASANSSQISFGASTRKSILVWIVILIIAIPAFYLFLKVSLISTVILVTAICLHLYLVVQRGFLQGRKIFIRLSGSVYVETFVKLLSAVILFRFLDTPETVILCIFLAYATSLIVTPKQSKTKTNNTGQSLTFKQVLPFLIQLGFIQITMNLDLLMMFQFNPELSGFYAVTIRYGQLIAYVMLSLQVVLIPYLSQGRRQFPMRLIVSVYFVFSLFVFFAYLFIVPISIPYLFGSEYLIVSGALPWVAISYLTYGLMNVLLLIYIIEEKSVYTYFMGAIVLLSLIIYPLMTQQITSMLLAQICIYGVASCALLINYVYNTNKYKNDSKNKFENR